MVQLEAVYAHLWGAHGDEFAVLDRSPGPRSWTFLFDVAGAAGLGPHSIVADVGCGRGSHCLELARRFGCRAIEQLPIRTGSIDFVWCRDMLVHVRSPELGIRECCRILRSGGRMLAWVTTEMELMEPREAERLYAPL